GGGVDLDVDVQAAAGGLEPAVEHLGDAQAVERVKLVGERGDILGLVGLQVPDHRPGEVEVGETVVLARGCLDFVLGEGRAAGRHRQPERVLGDGLADRQPPHLRGRAAHPLSGGRYPRLYGGDAALEVLYLLRLRVAGCGPILTRHDPDATSSALVDPTAVGIERRTGSRPGRSGLTPTRFRQRSATLAGPLSTPPIRTGPTSSS